MTGVSPSLHAIDVSMQRAVVGVVYRRIPGAVWYSVAMIWSSVYFLWDSAERSGLLIWAVLLTAFGVGRFAYSMSRIRSADFLDDPSRERRVMSLGLLLMSVGLAFGYLFFASRAPFAAQCAVSTFAIALCIGSGIVLTGCRLAFIAYTVPFISAVMGTLLWYGIVEGDAQRGAAAVVLMLSMCGVVAYQMRAEKVLLANIRLNLEKDELLARKDEQLAELSAANKDLSADRDAFQTDSLTDGLTGLANRRHFDRTLAREWERCRRDGASFACIMLDLDFFKHFNDRYGHMAGDDCLRSVADIIGATVGRGGDFAARYGGEEFVALLPGTDAAGGKVLAERIRALVEEQGIAHAGGSDGRVVTLSAGVAALVPSERFASAQSLVDFADEALYQAKKRGRNRVVVRDIDNDAISLSS